MIQTAFTTGMLMTPQRYGDGFAAAIGRLGGRLDQFWMSLGEYNVIFIVRVPDDVTVGALMRAAAKIGGSKGIKVTKLMSTEEAMESVRPGDSPIPH